MGSYLIKKKHLLKIATAIILATYWTWNWSEFMRTGSRLAYEIENCLLNREKTL